MDRDSAKFIKDLRIQDKNKDERLTGLETSEYTKIRMFLPPPAVLTTGNFAAGATFLSADQRPITSPNARGIFATIYNTQQAYSIIINMGSSDDSPGANHQVYRYLVNGGVLTGNVVMSQFVMIPLGADGKFKLVNDAASGGQASITLHYIGWWE